MAQVTLTHVSKVSADGCDCKGRISGGDAVQDFSLEVRDREFVVLAGPPGCGNSTVLRLVAGLDAVGGGEITIGNRPVTALSPKDRDVAMVFAHYALYPHLSGYANIAFGLKGRRFPKAEVDKRVRQAAEMTGIDALERKPQALTPLEQLRVALARAIVRQPKVLLLDDPLAALEPAARAGMRAELVKLQERLQTTFLYATQDPVEVLTLAHRAALMQAGALRQFDAPLALYQKPANRFAAEFLGQPPMNLLAGRLRAAQDGVLFKETDGTVEVKFADGPELKALAGKEVLLGIRPEDVQPVAPTEVKTRGVRCQGIIDHVEATGSDVYYYVQTGAHTVVLRGGPGGEPGGAGRRMQFDIDPQKVHLFDAETNARIL